MRKLLIATVLAVTTQNALAYSPMPLSFEWFGSMYQGFQENDQEIWRGKVIDVVSSTDLIIQNINGHKAQVKLLHLSPPKENNKQTIQIMTNAMTSLIGNNVYVLGKANEDNISARLVDAKGKDLNLSLVRLGAFDINTSSLYFKNYRKNYITTAESSKNLRRGIWFY
jgi:endonuclease YncB( thermonuclease family)